MLMFKISRIHYLGFILLLFISGFSSHSKIFHSFGDVKYTLKGFKWLSLPFRSEGSSTCHTYYDTGQPFISHLRGPVTLTPVAERLAVKLSLLVLITLVCPGDRTPISRLRGEWSTTIFYRVVMCFDGMHNIGTTWFFFIIGIAFWLCITVLPFWKVDWVLVGVVRGIGSMLVMCQRHPNICENGGRGRVS